MSVDGKDYEPALDTAAELARGWLSALPSRKLRPQISVEKVVFGELGPGPTDPVTVLHELATTVEPALMGMGSGRFFGWVIGGVLPAALATDWLVSTWDQNAGLRYATPGVVATEETAGRWLLELLGLPAGSAVGFVTGGTMANFACLAAGRERVLTAAGWDLATDGLFGAPRVRVLAGAERHDSIDAALRYLGLGAAELVPVDDQGRICVLDLTAAFGGIPAGTPTILCLQAGNLHSGAFDDFAGAIAVARAHGAWVHVDGAFGLWAGVTATHRQLVSGYEAADSWATDAHKTLNVPYDCGVAIVADPIALRGAMGIHADYLPSDAGGDPVDRVPELSRRARGVPVWAALRSLGRDGVAGLVDHLMASAALIEQGLRAIPGVEVLNDVVYTQVCFTVGDDARTLAVMDHLLADGTTWMSGSRWRGRQVIRVSVSNWSIDDADIAASLAAVRRSVAAVS